MYRAGFHASGLAIISLAFFCVAPALAAGTPAAPAVDMSAFNDTLAAGSVPCRKMSRLFTVLSAIYGDKDRTPDPNGTLMTWTMMVNASRVCLIQVRAETNDAAAAGLPNVLWSKSCSWIKATLVKPLDGEDVGYISAETSWSCGWPSRMPNFRPVPGMMGI